MKIEHIALYVADLEKMKNFYETYFDAKSNALYHNEKTQFKSYFLSFNSGARIEIMNFPALADKNPEDKRKGYIHLALSVGSKEKVLALTEQLRTDGYTITSEPRQTGDGYFESAVYDPEENIIEITV